MPQLAEAFYDDMINPLDGAEEAINTPELSFCRANRDELFVEAKGNYGTYRMMFMWDEMMGALQFCCEYEMSVADSNRVMAQETVLNINSGLWLGHFDLPAETLVPTFRYTQLFRGMQATGSDHVQDLIRIAIEECDRNFPAFSALSQSEMPDENQLSLALMPTIGHS